MAVAADLMAQRVREVMLAKREGSSWDKLRWCLFFQAPRAARAPPSARWRLSRIAGALRASCRLKEALDREATVEVIVSEVGRFLGWLPGPFGQAARLSGSFVRERTLRVAGGSLFPLPCFLRLCPGVVVFAGGVRAALSPSAW